MARRRVIFPPADYWTRPKEPTTMATDFTDSQLDAALVGVGLIEAQRHHNNTAAALLVEPCDGAGVSLMIRYLVGLIDQLLSTGAYGDPEEVIAQLRSHILDKMAAEDR